MAEPDATSDEIAQRLSDARRLERAERDAQLRHEFDTTERIADVLGQGNDGPGA